VSFGPRGHSGLSVSWPALLGAERVAALPEPVYERYRPANATRDRHPPEDVFPQYDAAFANLTDANREPAVEAMLRHLLGTLERLPEERRRPFFHGMSAALHRHGAPAGGGRLARVRTRLVRDDRYAAFQLLERARRARKPRRGRKLGKKPLDRRYSTALDQPIDPDLAVFAAYWYRGYSCNPRAIYERAQELVPGMRGVWVVKPEGAEAMPAGVDHVVDGTDEYYEAIARARYFVNNVNFPNYLVKRPGTTHVMTHHGTPLKRMGLDQQDSPGAAARLNFAALLRRCARWDFSVSANAFSTLIWERTYPLPYESVESGYPRNDALVNSTADEVAAIRSGLGIAPGQVAVLYAPTHREYEDGYVPTLDVASVADALGPGYTVLSRLHYFYDSAPDVGGRVLDVRSHPSIEELCLAADVLITDYSSIMFDYAVLDRPIVIHAPDWETYRTMRGAYFDLMDEPPGVVTTTEEDVVGALRSGRASDVDATAARAAFRARFCALEDGRAAERVVRRVWFGEPVATG
jgi:CDP-glycerol glycerophosphotransferase